MKTLTVLTTLLALAAAPADAQDPAVIRLLAGYQPGGGGDVVARALADALQAKLGTTVIVENRPGAGGVIAAQALKNAPADGLTFLITSDQLLIAPLTMKTANYDPLRDFTPVAGLNTFDVCFAVNAGSVSATTLNDYFAQARKDPKIASYGIPALGSLPQFYGYVMGKTAGVALNAVPYRGASPMVNDLVAGHLSAAVGPCREMMEQRKGGKLRFLATVQRLTWAPEVALFADSGVKLGPPSWVAVYAHAKVPADKLLAMQNAIRELMQAPSFPDRMTSAGFVPRYVPGKELGALAQEATTYWGAQIRESGFRPE